MNLRRKLLRKAGGAGGPGSNLAAVPSSTQSQDTLLAEKRTTWSPINEEDEDLLRAEVVRRHPPHYRRAYDKGKTIFEDGEEVNPTLHFHLHVLVEKQIRNRQPAFVREAVLALEQTGIDAHQVRHMLVGTVLTQTFNMMQQGARYDESEHRRSVEKLLREHLPQQ